MNKRALLKLLLAAPLAARATTPTRTLRIGFQKGGLLLLVKTQGLLEQRLARLSWQVKWLEFPAGPQLLEALNVDAIDFGVTGAPPPVFAQAAGTRFVYVAAEPGQPSSEAILVKPESPLRSLADLKGRRVGLQKGSSSHYLLIAALAKAGLRYGDIQPVFLPPADGRAAFERGAIDAWVVWDPYLTIAQAATQARVLADFGALAPQVRPPWSFYEARREFAEQNPELLRAHLIPLLAEVGAWANKNPEQAARVLAPAFGLDEALVLRLQRRLHHGAVQVSATIAADQQLVADAFFQLKVIPRPVAVKEAFWLPR